MPSCRNVEHTLVPKLQLGNGQVELRNETNVEGGCRFLLEHWIFGIGRSTFSTLLREPTRPMYRFDVSIHARPAEVTCGSQVELAGCSYASLAVPQAALGSPLPATFEAAAEAIRRIEEIYLEPDGYFVWVSRRGQPWQVDGHLYDRHERLLFVNLKGSCPPENLDRVLSAIGWPSIPLVFQLVREGVILDEAEFRRHAAT